jgi:hypothetical protein
MRKALHTCVLCERVLLEFAVKRARGRTYLLRSTRGYSEQ